MVLDYLLEFDGVAVILVTRQTETQLSDRTGKDKQVCDLGCTCLGRGLA